MANSFHLKDGLFFKRCEDNSVLLTQYLNDNSDIVLFRLRMTDTQWASIVAAVSEAGQDGERWQAALDFHNNVKKTGPPPPPHK